MTNHHIFQARPLRALTAIAVALAIVAASLSAAPSPASAAPSDPHCNYDFVTFNACLRMYDRHLGLWDADAGIGVYMSEQYAQQLIACGTRFRASLWGHDSYHDDDFITNMVLKPGFPIAVPASADYPSHLAAQFAVPVDSSQLNEDSGQDEIIARISYYDCNARRTHEFHTGFVRGPF